MSYYPLTSIPDYFGIDALLTEEHKLIRQSVREWVESFVMPKIDRAAQDHTDIPNLMKDIDNEKLTKLAKERIKTISLT